MQPATVGLPAEALQVGALDGGGAGEHFRIAGSCSIIAVRSSRQALTHNARKPTRKLPGRRGLSYEEEDWTDQAAPAYRNRDE